MPTTASPSPRLKAISSEIGQAGADLRFDNQPVDNDVDAVLEILVEQNISLRS